MFLFGAILACGVFVGPAHAQFSDLDLKMTEAERDSILSDYSNFFPLYGREIVAQGFRLPKPLGLNFNYFVADQAIEISNLQLGVNGSDLVDVSDYILFDDAQSYAQNVNLRADLWLFPFLNLYGIAGYTDARTTVKLKQPITLEAGAEM